MQEPPGNELAIANEAYQPRGRIRDATLQLCLRLALTGGSVNNFMGNYGYGGRSVL